MAVGVSDDDDLDVVQDASSGDESQNAMSDSASSANDDAENEDSDSMSSDDGAEDDNLHGQISKVSFSALARAQASITDSTTRKRKRGEETSVEQKSKLAAMRQRLQELQQRTAARENRSGGTNLDSKKTKIKDMPKQKLQRSDHAFFSEEDDEGDSEDGNSSREDSDDSGREDSGGEPRRRQKRSSKHAPTAMPANRAVGRYREVVDVPKIKSRDPRFDVTSGYLDRNVVQSRYSFLNDYQSDELTSLKKALKDPKAKLTADQREKLQRKVVSLESKIAATKARAREGKIRREHKKQEREAVAQGKKPFYLKNSDVKKQALVDRFEGMKSRQKDKVIQRRRKKLAAKERRDMPMARRA